MTRRMGRLIREIPSAPGPLGILRPALGLAKEDPQLRGRYEALGLCAEGTLGRAFHRHYVENGFAFPGDRHGIPEAMTFHDVGHVFSGYGVDPQGEIQQAAFQAGFMRKDGFSFLLFGILQFHAGMRLTPVAKARRGLFDVPRVLRAVARGAACKVDLSDGFDLFRHADEPLEALRERFGVPPQ